MGEDVHTLAYPYVTLQNQTLFTIIEKWTDYEFETVDSYVSLSEHTIRGLLSGWGQKGFSSQTNLFMRLA